MRKKIIIAGIIILLIISFVFLRNINKNPETEIFTQNNKIEGVWYSDRPDNDVLILNDDGTYSSSNWIIKGSYTIEGNKIILVDSFGTQKELEIKKDILYYENTPLSHTYFRSKSTAEESRNNNTKSEVEISENHEEEISKDAEKELSEVDKILKGTWIDNSELVLLTFEENDYTVHYKGNSILEPETKVYKYNITNVKKNGPGNYNLSWTKKDENDLEFKIDVTIRKDIDSYTIYSSSFPFARTFKKDLSKN